MLFRPALNSANFTRLCDPSLSVPTALEASASSMTLLSVSGQLSARTSKGQHVCAMFKLNNSGTDGTACQWDCTRCLSRALHQQLEVQGALSRQCMQPTAQPSKLPTSSSLASGV
eukprot:3766219-Amphidinium_carterae.2